MYRTAITRRVQIKGGWGGVGWKWWAMLFTFNCSFYFTKAAMKTVPLVLLPNLLNTLCKKIYSIITNKTSCFDDFHSNCKAKLVYKFTFNASKKRLFSWLYFKGVQTKIELSTSTWYTALLPWHLLDISSLQFWLDTQSGFSFSVLSHTQSRFKRPLGAEEVKNLRLN